MLFLQRVVFNKCKRNSKREIVSDVCSNVRVMYQVPIKISILLIAPLFILFGYDEIYHKIFDKIFFF